MMKNIVAAFNGAAAISGSGPDSGPFVKLADKFEGRCSKEAGRVQRHSVCAASGPGSALLRNAPGQRCNGVRDNRERLRIHSASSTREHDAVGPCATLRHHYDFRQVTLFALRHFLGKD